MAAILLDVDGVLHVSGEPIPGAVEAVARLREVGHRLRFVTNNSTRSRAALASELREMGLELEDAELQTTPIAAAEQLGGRRVYALVMSAIVPDLAGIDLVGEGADAVLVGGCDETTEPNQVFSYMNLARAFSEIQAGADLFCLHKNPWWQTARGPMLDAAALAALDAEPELTWMVTDDLEQDVRGAQLFGMKTLLLRTGKFRPEALERSSVVPDAVLSSIAHVPDWIDRPL
jgi:ribonucleotide monophosphatase NagD (HAD superfamily)